MTSNILSNEEIDKIKKLKNIHIVDNTIKKKTENYEKLQPFTKVIYKTKKNKKLIKLNKQYIENNQFIETTPISDPYRFKQIPKNIKHLIITFLNDNNMSIQTLCYKLKISNHILDTYLNNNGIIDNNDLYKILKYFNYTLDF